MKIVNILFNHKASAHDNQALGVERCFIDYAKYLILNGNELLSITKPNLVYREEVRKTGTQFVELPVFGRADIFSILRMAFLFIKFRADIVICHSGRALFFARMARFFCRKKIPIVAIDHGINPTKFLKADFVLTVNSFFSKELIKAGMPANRALVIPNMIEVPKNFPPLVKKPFGKILKLGSLGRLYPEKNFDKVLRAMVILRDHGIDCEYVIGGVGPVEKSLNDLAKELGLQEKFKILGWTTDKRKFFEEIDIFILPSYAETFGIVLLEAMLYSTPIITSNSWGPDEIIENEIDGLKVSINDDQLVPSLLADAIKKLQSDEDFAKQLAVKASEKFFKKYSADVVGKKLDGILKDCLKSF